MRCRLRRSASQRQRWWLIGVTARSSCQCTSPWRRRQRVRRRNVSSVTSTHSRGLASQRRTTGAACSDDCVTGGVCRGGVCTGHSARCDDGNACTMDGCGVGAGCEHQPVACAPPEDPCLVAVCDPVTGCGVAPVVDGVSCGGNDCSTAHVCISGQCVARAAPEGSECGAASACQGVGHCERSQCVPGPATQLPIAWTYHAPADCNGPRADRGGLQRPRQCVGQHLSLRAAHPNIARADVVRLRGLRL